MRVLIDTNVLMDYLTKREPYFESALKVVTACMLKKANGYLAAHSILNLFFILRHDYTNEQRRVMLQNMCVLLQIVEIDSEILLAALADESFPDFEDGVQARCAEACQADVKFNSAFSNSSTISTSLSSPSSPRATEPHRTTDCIFSQRIERIPSTIAEVMFSGSFAFMFASIGKYRVAALQQLADAKRFVTAVSRFLELQLATDEGNNQ